MVVPPSLHPCGDTYRWVRGPHQAALADLPDGWVERLERREAVTIAVPMPSLRTWPEFGASIIDRRAQMVARAGKGERNEELYRGTFYLAKLTESGLVEWAAARQALVWGGLACGLDRIEVERTIHSAAVGAGIER